MQLPATILKKRNAPESQGAQKALKANPSQELRKLGRSATKSAVCTALGKEHLNVL
jgi:uncharacterized protein involved in propanediol utilization